MATSVGVPGEGIAIILGVDRLRDMSRTLVNVAGDLTAACVIARSEGVLSVDPGRLI
jgi:Na+/H+-dicarboxylate symporter